MRCGIALTQLLIHDAVDILRDDPGIPANCDEFALFQFGIEIVHTGNSLVPALVVAWISDEPTGIKICKAILYDVVAQMVIGEVLSHDDCCPKCAVLVAD